MTVSRMPPAPHVIRLAGIWEIARSPEEATASRPSRGVSVEDDASIEWTRVRLDRLESDGLPFPPDAWRRFFNRPTNLLEGQAVFLEWLGLSRPVVIRVNGAVAAETDGGAELIRLRIDDRLTERNEVTLVLRRLETCAPEAEAADSPALPFRECRLAICETERDR